MVRGLAAFLVVIGHARNFLFIDYQQLSAPSHWVSVLFLITKAGHQGVIIFFVLSGYLISGSVLRSVQRGAWSWPSYLSHRLIRLWTVLLPGLILCALLDHYALSHHLAPTLYQDGAANHMSVDVAQRLTPTIFLQNLFFLQVMVAPPFGSDTALWSLAYEFWYYILFPLGFVVIARNSKLRARLLCAGLFIVVAWSARCYLSLFPVWLGGTVLALIPTRRLPLITRWLATLVYVPFFFLCASNRFLHDYSDYLLSVATVLFLWVILSATSESRSTILVRGTQEFARFSYSTYVVHMPFLLLLTALSVGDERWTPTPLTMLKACGIVTIVLAYCYAIASLTEFHIEPLRKWFERRWPVLRQPSPNLPQTCDSPSPVPSATLPAT